MWGQATRASGAVGIRHDLATERSLGINGLSCTYVLTSEPIVGEMQIDLRRGDRPVTGLGLQRFEGHAGLAEPGEAGVAQLVTRRMLTARHGCGRRA